jgi:hypothetical protein
MSRSTVHVTLTGLDSRAIVSFETDSGVLAEPPLCGRIEGSSEACRFERRKEGYLLPWGVEGKMHPQPRHSDVDGVDRAPGLHESSHSHDNEVVRISTFRRSQESLAVLARARGRLD